MDVPPDAQLAGVGRDWRPTQNEVTVRRSNFPTPSGPRTGLPDEAPAVNINGPAKSQPPAAGVRIARVYGALLIVVLLGALDHTIVATALPTVVGELDGARHMAWVVTAYALAMAVAMPIFGRLGDRFGRPVLLTISLAVFLAASVLCGFAQDIFQLSLYRGIQGLGGAGMAVLPSAIIADLVPPRQRPKYLGPLGSVFGIATVVSPLLGGTITDTVGWRWIFWINIPVGLLALALAFSLRKLRVAKGTGGVDAPGIALMIPFTCTLVFAVALSTDPDSQPEVVAAAAAAAIVLGIIFVAIEIRSKAPLIPMRMFRSWPVVNAAGLGLVVGAGLFSVVAYLPSYIQMAYSTSASAAGMILLPLVLGMMVASNLSGWIVTRTGRYKVFPLAGSALAVAAAVALSFTGPATPMPLVGVLVGLLGLAVGSFMQLTVVAAQNAMPQAIVGGVTASLGYLRELGVTVGTAVLGGLFAASLAQASAANNLDLPASAVTDPHAVQQLPVEVQAGVADMYATVFLPIFWVLAGIFAVGVLLSIVMPEQKLSESEPAT
ncbi:MFS transporter [Pseudarthrobacter sp. lyk4-40-TYG-27]|uniref:MFS transporter n=1 Tax=Pseudarthrobacter sp. lyk4-40-TYG-27 TaxID=3040305 RepID=UPI00255499BA|nr:MFS transporter [Pseudarthrobacter sp. lyk4-40-TYG-27]